MNIFKEYEDLVEDITGGVVVIGNFDGVHKGHRVLLEKGREIAQEKGVELCVLSFEPHPRSLFRPDEPNFRITPADLKAERLEEAGVDFLVSLPFDWDFASQPAEDFVSDILVNGLQAGHVVVGFDFRFGQMRGGDPETIKQVGLDVTVIDEIGDEAGKISSSTVRQKLRHGYIKEANALLGWEWEVRGIVQQGDQRGREIGYPTANFPLGDSIHPAYGIYAAWVQIEGEDEWRQAAINIGIRPMFEIAEAQVEAYIFDFDQEIYGKLLRVKPVQLLRSEAKFDSLEELVAQMDKDCQQAREILK